ncbi:hypothetical protein SEPCBS119000_004607, partial [Sporothrix epigloea]
MSAASEESAHDAKGMSEASRADLVAKKTAKVPEWETDDFAAVKGPALSELRTLFMRRGVYVGNFRTPGGSVAKCFADIVRTRDIAPWPDSAIKTLVKGGVLQSRNEDLQAAFPVTAIDPRFLLPWYYLNDSAAVPARVVYPAAPVSFGELPATNAGEFTASGSDEPASPHLNEIVLPHAHECTLCDDSETTLTEHTGTDMSGSPPTPTLFPEHGSTSCDETTSEAALIVAL